MKNLFKQYETAKKSALEFMRKGQINAYMNALIEADYYKRLIITVQSN
ncbi:hypothetical protein [Lutibacter sp.]|nr:hypothetical protein [Lutibacter sp.]MDP3312761.1 hypothetical protein [Lutibacter sp.]